MSLTKKEKDLWLDGMVILAIAILAFLFSFQAANDLWIKGNKGADSSVFQYVARVMQAGGMPYRDAFDHKGPLLYIINYVGIVISEWRGIWVLELLAIFVTFFFMYKTARIYAGRAISLSILLISSSLLFPCFEAGNLTEEYAMPFIAGSIYIFADYFTTAHINTIRLIACGFSFACVLMLRPNMCMTWVVLCVGVLIICAKKRAFYDLGRFIAWFLVGAALLIVPIVIWLAANGALKACWEDYILFNLNYSTDEARASLTRRMNALVFFIDRGLVWVTLIGFSILPQKSFWDILYLVYMVASVVTLCASGNSYGHYGMVLVPILAYPLTRMAVALQKNKEGGRTLSKIFLLWLAVTFAASPWLGGVQNFISEYDKRGSHFGERELELVEMVQAHSTQDDRIIVMGNYDIIYNLSGRFAASRYSYQAPPLTIDDERAEEFFREIQQNQPKLIVFHKTFGHERMSKYIEENNYYEVGKTTDQAMTVYCREK